MFSFHILFHSTCLAWGLNRGLRFNKPTHYMLDCGDFLYPVYNWMSYIVTNIWWHKNKVFRGFSKLLTLLFNIVLYSIVDKVIIFMISGHQDCDLDPHFTLVVFRNFIHVLSVLMTIFFTIWAKFWTSELLLSIKISCGHLTDGKSGTLHDYVYHVLLNSLCVCSIAVGIK